MKRAFFSITTSLFLFTYGAIAQKPEVLMYHPIRTDNLGKIKPWYSDNRGDSYDYVLNKVWQFWDSMRKDLNGIPYYMSHQVWASDKNDERGIGGDQLAMALSSFQLLYAYTGNDKVKEHMRFIADYYITHGFSPSSAKWPYVPFPYNTLVYSGYYDGDMILGKDYTQPDKAGSFGLELIHLYKVVENERFPNHPSDKRYLESAIQIANTLIKHIKKGDSVHSPLPFKINALTGESDPTINRTEKDVNNNNLSADYTSNWCPTMELFLELKKLDPLNAEKYTKSINTILEWMKQFAIRKNKWGPFFEDIPGWSDSQINAITCAQFMMKYPEYFPEWKSEVKGIFRWVYERLGNARWSKFGVTVVNEQTAYKVPGNSHTAREASAELEYASLTGDTSYSENAIRQLNWATYMVDVDGKNRYPQDDIWLTDGYGDYIRHYLRAMGAMPDLAPSSGNHLLSTTSVIKQISYPDTSQRQNTSEMRTGSSGRRGINYRTYDLSGREKLRLQNTPVTISIEGKSISTETKSDIGYYTWSPLETGGVLVITRFKGKRVQINFAQPK